jgi:hypothetical protein
MLSLGLRALDLVFTLCCAFILFCALSLSLSGHTMAAGGGEIRGNVSAQMPSGVEILRNSKLNVRLPNIKVNLLGNRSRRVLASTVTNSFGKFVFPIQTPGRYRLCFSGPGFVSSCWPTAVTIGNESFDLPDDAIIAPKRGVIWGQVRLQDGTICYQNNQVFDVLVAARVSLFDSAGVRLAGPVSGNDSGFYVLPGLSGSGQLSIIAECEAGTAVQGGSFSITNASPPARFDLIVKNAAPRMGDIVVRQAGNTVRRIDSGGQAEILANGLHPFGQELKYQWNTAEGKVLPSVGPSVDLTGIVGPGGTTIYFRASDGKGGAVTDRITLQADRKSLVFQGTVRNRDNGAPVANATVNLSTSATKTNGEGVFNLKIPAPIEDGKTAERYVVNVRADGFALASQIFYWETKSADILLDAARVTNIEATEGGTATWFDPKNENLRAQVDIQGKTLVDGFGKEVSGPIAVSVRLYDISKPNAIPGDLSAVDENGKNVRLETFGAIDVTLKDANGQTLNLAPGKTAEVKLSVPPSMLASAPPKIPFFSYDEDRGLWMQEGEAGLVGGMYQGTVKHFSAFNADSFFTDTACIKLTVDPVNAPAFPFKIRISYPTSSAAIGHNDFPVTERINGLFRLPANTDVQIEIHPSSGPDTSPLKTITVNSGPAIDSAFDGFPPFDFGACGAQQTLSLDLPPHLVTYLGMRSDIGAAQFETETKDYWKTVGALDSSDNPTAQRGTFSAWKSTNGFNDDPSVRSSGEIRAIYFNDGDLQFGRDMHCRTIGNKSACYVSNFGSPGGDPAAALHDATTNPHLAVPTVAMEYDPALVPHAVRFYAYQNNALLPNPVLDSEGPKRIPRLCIACHGGSYDPTAKNINGASFIPFDAGSFKYDQVNGYSYDNQKAEFRKLNEFVKNTQPNNTNTNDPIKNLIDAWYAGCGGVAAAGCNPSLDDFNAAIPTSWPPGTKNELYRDVVRPFCRGCHVSLGRTLDWTIATQITQMRMDSITNAACPGAVINHFMPHAEVPFKRFWFSTNPHAPGVLADAAKGIGLPGGACQ